MKSTLKNKDFAYMMQRRNYFIIAQMIAEEQTRVNFTESKLSFDFNGEKVINPFRTPDGQKLGYADAISLYGLNRMNEYIINVAETLITLKNGMNVILDTEENIVRALRTLRELELAQEENRIANFEYIKKDYPNLFNKKVECN